MKKIFYILSDDKTGAGPRLQPHSLSKPVANEPTAYQPMETDSSEVSVSDVGDSVTTEPTQQLSLSSKLAAQAAKRKASEPADARNSKSRR